MGSAKEFGLKLPFFRIVVYLPSSLVRNICLKKNNIVPFKIKNYSRICKYLGESFLIIKYYVEKYLNVLSFHKNAI